MIEILIGNKAIKFYRIALQLDADIEYKACCNDMEPKNSHEAVLEKEVASEINENKPFDTDESKESSLYDQFRQETLTENNFCSKKFPQSVSLNEVLLNVTVF